MESKSTFQSIAKKISELPLWIKQVVYLQLKNEFKSLDIWDNLNLFNEEDCLQLYTPKITLIGKKELEIKSRGLHLNVYKFLQGVTQELSIMEIAIGNNWSLVECASYFITSINAELVSSPKSACVKGTAMYLSGSIRIGEYFVQLGKVNLQQLNETLKAQKYIQETLQDNLKLGKILVDLGLLTEDEIAGIVLLKDESKKKYNPGFVVLDEADTEEESIATYKEKISLLETENLKLKEKLRKVLKG